MTTAEAMLALEDQIEDRIFSKTVTIMSTLRAPELVYEVIYSIFNCSYN